MDHNVSELRARHMRRPGQEAILEVTGECKLPATYRAVLNVADQQGDDPSQLVLDLIINDPSNLPATGVENRATLNISFKMKTDTDYSTVKITDLLADPDTTDPTEWVLPVRQINWDTTPQPAKSRRWKGEATTAHRQQ